MMPKCLRVDRTTVIRLVERIENAAGRERQANGDDVLQAAEELRNAVGRAYPIPLTNQVRLPRGRAAQIAATLRANTR